MDFKEKLLERIEKGDDINVEKYVNFVLSHAVDVRLDEEYYEVHHILPKCYFLEHDKTEENTVTLLYSDHCTAHVLLSDAFPLSRKLQRPCNFMSSDKEKNHNRLSNITKYQFEKFKQTEEYALWVDKASKRMKTLTENGENWLMNAQAAIVADPEKKREQQEKRTNSMNEYWAGEKAPERREEIKSQLRKRWANPEYKENQIVKLKERWADEEFHEKMKDKMIKVNKDEGKRKRAGATIKKLWEDPEYREMMNRKRKPRGPNRPGVLHTKFIGWYHTPWGKFPSMRSAILSVENKEDISLYQFKKYLKDLYNKEYYFEEQDRNGQTR